MRTCGKLGIVPESLLSAQRPAVLPGKSAVLRHKAVKRSYTFPLGFHAVIILCLLSILYQLNCSRSNQGRNGFIADQVLGAFLQVNHVVPEKGGNNACRAELVRPGEADFLPSRSHAAHLCSSVSGSTRMFSCRSFTLRNTYESRSGLGTVREMRVQSENTLPARPIWESG